MIRTSVFWEKTRETPDHAIGPGQETGPGPFGMNEDPGHFFPLFPITTMHDPIEDQSPEPA
jgi:hypothetical protein